MRCWGTFHSGVLVTYTTDTDTLSARVKRTRKTVKKWLRLAGVEIIHNVFESEREMVLDAPDKELQSQGWFVRLGRDGKRVWCRQLVNSYRSNLEKGNRGRARKVRLDDSPGSERQRGRATVRYFPTLTQKSSRLKVNELRDGDYEEGTTIYSLVGGKSRRGVMHWQPRVTAMVWEGHSKVLGEATVL